MRIRIRLLMCAGLLTAHSALAEERFGHYGYGHQYPDVHKAIDELMRMTQKNCCDGVKGPNGVMISGGECRVTKTDMMVTKVWIDGHWCPIQHDTALRSDIPLPNDVQAIACAPQQDKPQTKFVCPKIYCLAAKFGS